tara:strand:+ start:562 stop:720 length:159 start_codon:yes stop_codon:yes gene_type:complete
MRKYGSFWRTPFILWLTRQIGYLDSWLWRRSWQKDTPPLKNKGWGNTTIDME